jgi:uncharacterized protein (TIGR04222 family)
MDILHNPITNMSDSTFFLFYTLFISATAIVCTWMYRVSDRTRTLPSPLIPAQPDAYLIAYLRNGEKELAHAIVFNLTQHGMLEINSRNIAQSSSPPPDGALSPIERYVFDWCSQGRRAEEVFQPSSSLVKGIKPFCDGYQKRLASEQMLASPEQRRRSWLILLLSVAIVLALGSYKWLVVVDHPNIFLLALMLILVGILLGVCHVRRVSVRGSTHLKQLQLAFGSVKTQIKTANTPNTDPSYLLAMSLFGVATLAGTQYGHFQVLYSSAMSSNSGGGGGCSSGGGCSTFRHGIDDIASGGRHGGEFHSGGFHGGEFHGGGCTAGGGSHGGSHGGCAASCGSHGGGCAASSGGGGGCGCAAAGH